MRKADKLSRAASETKKAYNRIDMAETYVLDGGDSAAKHDVLVAVDKLESALKTLKEEFDQ